jgi:predicted TIM-barrel fold metal-dependent hydrolase
MIVPNCYDCDAWIGDSPEFPTGGIDTADELLEEMDRVGIDRAVVYDVEARTDGLRAGNDRVLEVTRGRPRLTPAWVLGPSAIDEYGSVEAIVRAMDDAGVRVVRLFPKEHDFRLDDEACRRLLDGLEAIGAVIVLDARADVPWDGFTSEEVARLCRHHHVPGLDRRGIDVVLTRLQPGMGTALEDTAIFEHFGDLENLYVDTSRLQAHDAVGEFVRRFGADRLVFGSHLPQSSAGASLATVMQSPLDRDQKERILATNLTTLLGESRDDWAPEHRGPIRQFRSVPYEIVDVHSHILDDRTDETSHPDAVGLVEQMDRTGISVACVSGWPAIESGEKEGNDVTARAVRRYPDRLIGAAVADPRWDDVTGELERCFEDFGMRLIKLHCVHHDVEYSDARYEPVWEFAEGRTSELVLHTGGFDDQMATIEHIATEYDVDLTLYHAASTWDTLDNYVDIVESCPNVSITITWSNTFDGTIEYLAERVDTDRFLFDTDMGVRAPESQVGWATYARIDPEVRRDIMYDNGRRYFERLGVFPDGHPTAAEHEAAPPEADR